MRLGYKIYLVGLFILLGEIASTAAFQSDEGKQKGELDRIYASRFYLIYKKILQPRCSVSGCHDGNFEPDFRTIQSSYSTLVNQKIIKNDRAASYAYRVVPLETLASVLYQRVTRCCFVDSNDRMPFYDKAGLSKADIQLIADWITNGAPNILDEMPSAHVYVPTDVQSQYQMYGYKMGKAALVDQNSKKRTDNFYNSTIVRPDFDSIRFIFSLSHSEQTDTAHKSIWQFDLYKDRSYTQVLFSTVLHADHDSLSLTMPVRRLPQGKHLFFRIIDKNDTDNKKPVDQSFISARDLWSIFVPVYKR